MVDTVNTSPSSDVDVSNLLGGLPSSVSSMLRAGGANAQKKADIEAKTQEALAEKTAPINEAYRKQVEQQGQTQQRIGSQLGQPYQVPQETVSDYAQLGGIVAMLGVMLGKSGKQSANNVLAAIDGTLKGYQQGRKDMIATSQKEFETNMKRLQAEAQNAAAMLENATKLRSVDLDKANQEIALLKAKYGQGIASSDYIINNAQKAIELSTSIRNSDINAGNLALRTKEYNDRIIQQKIANTDYYVTTDGKTVAHDRSTNTVTDSNGQKLDPNVLAGASKVGVAQNRGSMVQSAMAQRAVNALRNTASVSEVLQQLPANSNIGVLNNLQTKDGMFNFLRNQGARKVSGDEAQALEVLYTGVSRSLAQIESSGAATGLVGLSKQMEKLEPKAGDSAYTTALKIADIRRVATEGMAAYKNSGFVQPGQIKEIDDAIARLEKAIPYTPEDVVKARFGGKQTLQEKGSSITGKGSVGSTSFATEADAEQAAREGKIKPGQRITIGGVSGTWSQ